MTNMIIHSFNLALAIVASLLALVFCALAIQGMNRDRRRTKPDLLASLEAERAKRAADWSASSNLHN
jgi:hypothetical protein